MWCTGRPGMYLCIQPIGSLAKGDGLNLRPRLRQLSAAESQTALYSSLHRPAAQNKSHEAVLPPRTPSSQGDPESRAPTRPAGPMTPDKGAWILSRGLQKNIDVPTSTATPKLREPTALGPTTEFDLEKPLIAGVQDRRWPAAC